MPTTVVKSIGTSSRNYSTLQSWEDASPSNLTTTRANTCTGGTTSTIILDVGASATNDFYTGHTVTNASAEERLITAYNGTTKVATIGALNGSSATWTAPTTGQAFTINSVIWQGQAYNDSEFTAANRLLQLGGSTADAVSYMELTAAAGQSFQDSAGVRSNALQYNVANGVGLRATGTYGAAVVDNGVFGGGVLYFRMSRLQIKNDGTNSLDTGFASNQTGVIVKDCVFKTVSALGCHIYTSSLAINCLCFLSGASGNGMRVDNGSKAIGCTVIRTKDQSAAGVGFFNFGYGSNILQSCACFGFSTAASATAWDTTNSKNNAASNASGLPGTANQHGITFTSTSPFTNSTVASQNSIPVTGTNLSANGFLDATNAPNDITGTARTATPTIGVWELVSAVTVLMSMWNSPPRRPVDNPIKVVGY